MSLFSELKRRNVLRVAVAYLAAAWLITEVSETIFPLFGYGDTPARIVVILLAIGLPLFLIFSWVFEITPEGLKLEKDVSREESITQHTGKRIDRLIIVLLALALGYFAFDKFVLEPSRVAEIVEETAQQARSHALVEAYGDQSIAVLPFVNLSADPEQEYFSDGISEELLNLLAKIPELRVISRSSAFAFKGERINIPEVAKKLNVEHVLEGSVRKSGNRVRITAQLIEARSDTHLWSDTYDRELDDIFTVQDEIAAAISESLRIKLALATGEAALPTAIRAANLSAYDAYLRGRELINRRGRENMEGAIRLLERSLRLDEGFSPAHAQLAIANILLSGYHASYQKTARRIALAHLDRAQELEPELAEAHAGRALLANQTNDPEATIEHARKALAANRNYIDAMNWLRQALFTLGRYEESISLYEQMSAVDPLSVIGRANYAFHLSDQGRTEEAHEIADQLHSQSPWAAHRVHAEVLLFSEGKIAESLSWALRMKDDDVVTKQAFMWAGEYGEARRFGAGVWADILEQRWDTAIPDVQESLQQNPDSIPAIEIAANAFFYAGRIDEALPLYERLIDLAPEGRPIQVQWSLAQTMRLALLRRRAGDEEGAQAAVQIVKQDYTARRAVGTKSQFQDLAAAMLAAFEHDAGRAISALQSAIQHGLRFSIYLEEPIFDPLQYKPRFVALQKELDDMLAEEHAQVLQLICFNNPVPDDWQPLAKTCEGVEDRSKH